MHNMAYRMICSVVPATDRLQRQIGIVHMKAFVFAKIATNARRGLAPRLGIARHATRFINGNRAEGCYGSR